MRLGYTGPPDLTAGRAFTSWHLDGPILLVVVALAAWYVLSVRAAGRLGQRWRPGRSISWALGLLTVVLATQSFLGVYAHTLFWVYTTQVTLLLTLAPALLVMGAPVRLLVASRPGSAGAVARVTGSWPVRVLTFPLVGALLLALFPFLLFFTPLFEATLRHQPLFSLLQVVVLLVGFCFYWSILGVDETPGLPFAAIVVIVFFETLLDSVPGIVLWLRTDLLAAGYYRELARPWGRSLVSDQNFGGLMLWGIGELIGVPLLLVVAIQWMRQDAREARRIDAELDRQEEEAEQRAAAEAHVIADAEAAARGEDIETVPGADG